MVACDPPPSDGVVSFVAAFVIDEDLNVNCTERQPSKEAEKTISNRIPDLLHSTKSALGNLVQT